MGPSFHGIIIATFPNRRDSKDALLNHNEDLAAQLLAEAEAELVAGSGRRALTCTVTVLHGYLDILNSFSSIVPLHNSPNIDSNQSDPKVKAVITVLRISVGFLGCLKK